jgi:cholesterol 7alpha-monooxygenase/oxysterol 7-alpha-hydroxylase
MMPDYNNNVSLLLGALALLSCSYLFEITFFRGKNPPFVRYYLPWFGSLLSVGTDLLGWVQMQSERHGPLFSAYMGGKTFIFVCDRKAGMRVINSKDLSWKESRYNLQRNALGMNHIDAWGISQSAEKREIQTRHLLQANMLPTLLENYQKHTLLSVYPNLLQDTVTGQAWMKKGLFDFFGEAIWRATVTVLYGLPELETHEAFKLAVTFDERFVKFFRSPLFQKIHWKQYKAREDLIGLIRNALQKRDEHGDDTIVFKEKVGMELDHMCQNMGTGLDGRARFQALSIHAAVLNTVPTTFWLVYHLLENSVAYDEVVDELQQIKKKSKTTFFSVEDLNQMTKLDSVLMETLRLDSTNKQFRPRYAERDMELELPFDDGTKRSFQGNYHSDCSHLDEQR